ncbi:MAG: hypothetical protein IPJ03_16650 [Ignavibacteriales bacterium]|nr:hypothetical protein [Ignavibacteriales bacterium]
MKKLEELRQIFKNAGPVTFHGFTNDGSGHYIDPQVVLDLLADREQLREALEKADIYYADDKSRTEIIREALKKSDEVENG